MFNEKFDLMKNITASAPKDIGNDADVGGGMLCSITGSCGASCASTCGGTCGVTG